MDDRISLRPTSSAVRLGPSTDFFAAFRTGAGQHLRSKNREAQWDDGPAKRPEDRVRYSRNYLLKLREGFKETPSNVNVQIACFRNAEEFSESWTKSSTMAPDIPTVETEGVRVKEEKWTATKSTAPETKTATNGDSEPSPTPPLAPLQEETVKFRTLQKAEELGREAYRPRSVQEISDDEKAIRQVNGTLNKLTPDNFDRLVQQIVEFVKNANVLQKCISLVFEKAVAEPTFCALYADLCERLSKQISDFPPAEGEKQKLTFRRVLLNTCQDEFEGVEEARTKLDTIEESTQREQSEKIIKDRTLGNMRLISELFNKGLVAERIMHSCIKDLLLAPQDAALPHEDNLEAVCEVLTLAGKKLAQGSLAQSHIPAYMTRLERCAKTRGVPSRIIFLIRDVMDMQQRNWVPRREKFTAKKIEEIHAQAETELGIQLKLPQPRQQAAKMDEIDDVELFPMPKGISSGSEWKAVSDRLNRGPMAVKEDNPPKTEPEPKKQKEYANASERERATVSMIKEYISSADKNEAVLCAEEICASDNSFAKHIIQTGMQEMFDCVSERDQKMIMDLLNLLMERDVFNGKVFVEGLQVVTNELEDLSLDIPKSPDLCGRVFGHAVVNQHCSITTLPSLCQSIPDVEIRRKFALAMFSSVQESDQDLHQMCVDSDIHAEGFLKADPDHDMPNTESVKSFLEKNQLIEVIPL